MSAWSLVHFSCLTLLWDAGMVVPVFIARITALKASRGMKQGDVAKQVVKALTICPQILIRYYVTVCK